MKKRALKLFLYWMVERHKIYIKKENGDPWPWTKDPILKEYKFTNPFRQNDAVTKELKLRLREVKGELGILRRIVIFRMFNWPPTYDLLASKGLVDTWNTGKAINVLRKYAAEGNKVFTGAYIITNSGSERPKIDLVCEAINEMIKWDNRILSNIKNLNTLEGAVEELSKYKMVGAFIAYELVTDLRHTSILKKAKDIYTWANPGPGCKRGIHRLLFETVRGDKPRGSMVDYQSVMQKLIPLANDAFTEVLVPSGTPGMRDMVFAKVEMRDIEHSLCEFDKYMRVKKGEGRPRGKYHAPK